jgi:thiamine biosynthesis protein ThiS
MGGRLRGKTTSKGQADNRIAIMIQLIVNGEPHEVPPDTTVAGLLVQLKMQPRLVAVERNRDLVPRGQHAACMLEPGDHIEIVTLVGGG